MGEAVVVLILSVCLHGGNDCYEFREQSNMPMEACYFGQGQANVAKLLHENAEWNLKAYRCERVEKNARK